MYKFFDRIGFVLRLYDTFSSSQPVHHCIISRRFSTH
nr:MAG TPA: hypothetical protein [Caudoviricetes sp.]